MRNEELPRFPVPPSGLDDVVSNAHIEVDLQVLRSTIAAKKALGFDVEDDELDLHIAESSVEYHQEADAHRNYEARRSHIYGTRRPRECGRHWPDAQETPLTTSELKEAASYWKRAFLHDCQSDPDPNGEGNTHERREPDAHDMFMDFLAALDDSDVEEFLREKDEDAFTTWTLDDVRNAEARLLAEGCLVEPEWLQAIFAGGAEQAEVLTRDAILQMGRSGFSPTFQAAAQWLHDRAVHKMPVSVEACLAFLRVLAERDVVTQMPDEPSKHLAARIAALTDAAGSGVSASNWEVATNIFLTERLMRSIIVNANTVDPVADVASTPGAPTRRARRAQV